jgi:hypothetical protein
VLTRRLAVAVALIAGVIGSQGPDFAEQYRQRMGGASDRKSGYMDQCTFGAVPIAAAATSLGVGKDPPRARARVLLGKSYCL